MTLSNLSCLSEEERYYLAPKSIFFIGIDPGLKGAIAVLDDTGNVIDLWDMPVMAKSKGKKTVKNQVNAGALCDLLLPYMNNAVTIERVSAMPGQGVSSVFSFGDTVGAIRGVCCALKMRLQYVTASSWKKHYGLPADKELARAKAIELYPSAHLPHKKDADKAEAILIARYGYESSKRDF